MLMNQTITEGTTGLVICAMNKTDQQPQLCGISAFNRDGDNLNGVSISITICKPETVDAVIEALHNAKRVWNGEQPAKITTEEMKQMQEVQ